MQATSFLLDFMVETSGFAFQPGQWHESLQNELAGVMTQLLSHHASEEPSRMLLQTEAPATRPTSTTLGFVTLSFGLGDASGVAGLSLAAVAFAFLTSLSQAPVLKWNSVRSSAWPSPACSARPATSPTTRSAATSRSILGRAPLAGPNGELLRRHKRLPNGDMFFS